MNGKDARESGRVHSNAGDNSEAISPPFQIHGERNLVVRVRFDPDAARRLLPPDIRMVKEATGGFYFVQATGGIGLGEFTDAMVWLDVMGFDSSDGTPGRFAVANYCSDALFRFRTANSKACFSGESTLEEVSGGLRVKVCPSGQSELISVTVDPSKDGPEIVSYVVNYIGPHPSGSLFFAPVPQTKEFVRAAPVEWKVSAPSNHVLSRTKPTELLDASASRRFSYTLGFGRALSSIGARPVEAMFSLLSQLRKGALLVEETGQVLFVNALARDALGDAGLSIVSNKLTAVRRGDRIALQRILKLAVEGSRGVEISEVIAVRREADRSPLLIAALPSSSIHAADLTGRLSGAALVLVTDPEHRSELDASSRVLELLGLTPAEARIAGAAGAGLRRKDIASRLTLTEATVRSTLTQIYAKLGIARQSELALLVSRLEALT